MEKILIDKHLTEIFGKNHALSKIIMEGSDS